MLDPLCSRDLALAKIYKVFFTHCVSQSVPVCVSLCLCPCVSVCLCVPVPVLLFAAELELARVGDGVSVKVFLFMPVLARAWWGGFLWRFLEPQFLDANLAKLIIYSTLEEKKQQPTQNLAWLALVWGWRADSLVRLSCTGRE